MFLTLFYRIKLATKEIVHLIYFSFALPLAEMILFEIIFTRGREGLVKCKIF